MCSKLMVAVMIHQMMVMMAQESVGIARPPTIVKLINQRVDVMCAAIWRKPPPSTNITSRGGLQYMDVMFIFLLHRKTNCVGSFTAVRTLSGTYNMLGAQQMCA
jgi:hypothetical protein